MVLGIGVDLVDVERFGRVVRRHGAGFLERLLQPAEIAACRRGRRTDEQQAARFAAREALLKALGTGLVGRMSWHDIEVQPGPTPGLYRLRLDGEVREVAERQGVRRVHVSLATTRQLAAAAVVLEGGPG